MTFPQPFGRFLKLSLTASAILLVAPFLIPEVPIAPFLILNWLAFMAAGYVAFFRPFRLSALIEQPDRSKLKGFNLALIAFAVAGWVAFFNAERIG